MPNTPTPQNWKRKLNLDRINARRDNGFDNDSSIGPTDQTQGTDTLNANNAPQFQNLMKTSQGKGFNDPIGPASKRPIGGGKMAEGSKELKEWTEKLARENDETGRYRRSGIPTGMEGKNSDFDAKQTPTGAKSQMSNPTLPMPQLPTSGGAGSSEGKTDDSEQQKKRDLNEARLNSQREMAGSKSSGGASGTAGAGAVATTGAADKAGAAADGAAGKAGAGAAGGKAGGYDELLKRLQNMPGTVTGKIGTVIRIILAFVGGLAVINILDGIMGEKMTDKMLTMDLLANCACQCCLPLLPIIILVGLLGAIL